jgi:hypothetical protein
LNNEPSSIPEHRRASSFLGKDFLFIDSSTIKHFGQLDCNFIIENSCSHGVADLLG